MVVWMVPSMNTSSPERELTEIVKEARDGDPQAFEALVRRTENLVKRISLTILSESLLDDAVQETYLLVFQKLDQLKNDQAFVAWMSRMALHVCYRLARESSTHSGLVQEPASKRDMEEDTLNSLILRKALARLQQRERDVLILRELLGLSYDDVAYSLRLPVGTVRSRLHKARRHLKQRLQVKG
jgi:RNA polymerase sigma-70 factor (ECF subfamily)